MIHFPSHTGATTKTNYFYFPTNVRVALCVLCTALKDYFQILGLQPDATEEEIRSAFRRLVKMYHPDRNEKPDAHHQFVEIQQAYEYLSDADRRQMCRLRLSRGMRQSTSHQLRREEIYAAWVRQQKDLAQRRAAMEAVEEEVEASLFTRIANKMMNGIFFLFFVLMIVIPVYKYIDQQSEPESNQRSFLHFLIPTVIGLIFVSWSYYYWFVMKKEKDEIYEE